MPRGMQRGNREVKKPKKDKAQGSATPAYKSASMEPLGSASSKSGDQTKKKGR